MTGYRSLARNRDFAVLWTGDTINELGLRVSMFAFPLLTYSLSGSTLWAAWVEAALLTGLAVTLLPAGVLVDRLDLRRVMVGALGIGALAFASLSLAGLAGTPTVPHILVVALIVGAATGLYNPAQTSAIRAVVPTADLPTALATNQARVQVAELLGGPLGGVLFAVARWLPFAANTTSYVVAAVAVLALRTDLAPAPRPRGTRLRADLADGLRFVWERPFFRVLLTWGALANLVWSALYFVIVMRLLQSGVHPGGIGLVSAAAGAGGLLGALVAPYVVQRVPAGWLAIAVSWFCMVPVSALIWLDGNATAAAVCLFVTLLPLPAANAGVGAYRMAVTPRELQGRVASASQFLAVSILPAGPLLGGVLLQRYGGPATLAALVIVLALLAIYLTASRSIRAVGRPADWPELAPAPVREPVHFGADSA